MNSIEIDGLVQTFQDITQNLRVSCKHHVLITHINTPHDFYVRPMVLSKFMPSLLKHTDAIEPSDIENNSIVAYRSDVCGGDLIRGEIRHFQKDGETIICELFSTDYGFTEKNVPLQKIYKSHTMDMVPPLIIHCSLGDCLPKQAGQSEWDMKTIEVFKYLVGTNEKCVITIMGNLYGKYVVELSNETFHDLAMVMAMGGFSVMGYKVNQINRLCTPDPKRLYFTYNSIDKNKILHVRVLSGKTLDNFYVAIVEDYNKYIKNENLFQNFSQHLDNLKEEDILVGRAVSACHFYGEYGRATIKKVISLGKVVVSYIDSGVSEEVPVHLLKELPECYFEEPALAIYCTVNQDSVHNSNLMKLLRIPGTEFTMKVLETGVAHLKPNLVEIIDF